MSEHEIRGSNTQRKWLWGCMGMIALCAGLSYAQWFFWGYVPLSTLPVVTYPPELPRAEICPDKDPLHHVEVYSYFSPDGKYYLDGEDSRYRDAGIAKLFRTSDHQLLGTHSYRYVGFECWEKDSSGVYVRDFIPSSLFPSIPPFPESGSAIAVRKLLIPCQSSLDGVSLFPRLYWEMRCALPGSEYSPFAIWFPMAIMIALVTVGGWLGLKGVHYGWRHCWIRTWWYGE